MDQRPCRVPTVFGYMNLAEGLNNLALRFDQLDPGSSPTLDLRQMEFCDPAATVALAAFVATALKKTGQPVPLDGWDAGSYLSRVGLKQLAGHKDDFPRKRLDSDRMTSLTKVAGYKERLSARKDVLNVLDVHHDGARRLLDYCLEEILRNVDDHAFSPIYALLQAQYYEKRGEVVMAIADTGNGILKSLRPRHQTLATHDAALKAALQKGVSGRNTRKGTNAGLGLTVSSALVTKMGGTFQIMSGDCLLEVTGRGQNVYRLRQTEWPGVIVVMVVPRNDALDWDGTFIEVMSAI